MRVGEKRDENNACLCELQFSLFFFVFSLNRVAGWADFVLISALIWLNSCAPQTFEEAVLNAIDDQVFADYWAKANRELIH